MNSEIDGAIFSEDRKYRYLLWRTTGVGKGAVTFVGLNPSTADERVNDPTIRRCLGFARSWGYQKVYVANIFAYRTAYPTLLMKTAEPIGELNDNWILSASKESSLVVVAWGNVGQWLGRAESVLKFINKPRCLGITKLGAPRHPLYVSKDVSPLPYLFSE